MGHRLTTALIFLNAMGLFACLILIAANCNQTPDVAIHFTRAIQFSIRTFIVGVALSLAAWEIAAAEFDRSNVKVRLLNCSSGQREHRKKGCCRRGRHRTSVLLPDRAKE
jgi:hypothetical protein